MASGNGGNIVPVESTEGVLLGEKSASDIDSGQNGDIYMDNNLGTEDSLQNTQNGKWNTARHKKRRRQNTGSVDLEHFENLNRDEQLSAIFAKLIIFEQTQNKINTLEGQVRNTTQRVSEVERHTGVNAHGIKMLTYKQLDIETKMRRTNLIIRGLREERNENIYDIIDSFLSEKLNLAIEDVSISEAYRLGSYKSALNRVARSGNEIRRPVLVTFRYPADADFVLSLAYMLKGSRYSIDKDYPAEIAAARRRLWPDFKRLRTENPRSKVLFKYPARVEVDGNTVIDLFPDWGEIMRGRFGIESNTDISQTSAQPQRSASPFRVEPNQQVYEADTESGNEYERTASRSDITVKTRTRKETPQQTNSILLKEQINNNDHTDNLLQETDNNIQNQANKVKNNVQQQQTHGNRQPSNVNNNTRVRKTSSVKGGSIANESHGNQPTVTPIIRGNIPRE